MFYSYACYILNEGRKVYINGKDVKSAATADVLIPELIFKILFVKIIKKEVKCSTRENSGTIKDAKREILSSRKFKKLVQSYRAGPRTKFGSSVILKPNEVLFEV